MITKTHPGKTPKKRGRGRPTGTKGIKHRKPAGDMKRAIRDDESFEIDEFCDRMAMSRMFLRRMADEGLPIRKLGKYRFISGKDFNEFIRTRPQVISRRKQAEICDQQPDHLTTAGGEGPAD